MEALAKSLKQVRTEYKQLMYESYIALEDLDFIWRTSQVREFDQLWRAGWSLYYISDHFRRDPDEVVLLSMDRIRKNFIHERKGGVFGWRGRQS